MAEDYKHAAVRHWRDGELLVTDARLENADQFYGVTAECAIKVALVTLPAFSNKGALLNDYRLHIKRTME